MVRIPQHGAAWTDVRGARGFDIKPLTTEAALWQSMLRVAAASRLRCWSQGRPGLSSWC